MIPYNAGVHIQKNNRAGVGIVHRIVWGLCLALGLGAALGVGDADGGGKNTGGTPVLPVPPVSVVSIPASRQADRIAVITVKGAIDQVTALSVKRRIEAAEKAGMEAMVFEINSPGGELGAVLEISNAIKSSSIDNTVAWVRPDAYSGGAIIALACDEIVTSDPASFGDSFVITFGPGGLRGLSPDERTKLLPPLMSDVMDSARRSGFDEYLTQAIVVDGIELWLVEDVETGERIAINEEEYRLVFEGDVVRGKPMLAEVTGGVKTYREKKRARQPTDSGDVDAGDDAGDDAQEVIADVVKDEGGNDTTDTIEDDPNAYRPASPTLEDIASEFENQEEGYALEVASDRVFFTAADRGKYRLVGYITDGSSAIVMRDDQMQYFGFSSGIVQDDEELMAFFGADEMVRVRISVTERVVRFLLNPFVRGVLIVVLLMAVFVEMMMAGTGIAGTVAIGALVLLFGPGALIGLSGWWELIAIVLGVIFLAIEAFVVPGFGVFGVIGFVALFGGLIASFVGAGGSMSDPSVQKDLMTGTVTVFLAFITAGIGWWLLVKNAQSLPLFDKFVLSGASGVGGMPQKTMLHAIVPDDGSVKVGDEGVTTTPLFPIGQADIEGEIVDVYSAFGFIESGVRVRVVSATKMRIEVEAVDGDSDVDADIEEGMG